MSILRFYGGSCNCVAEDGNKTTFLQGDGLWCCKTTIKECIGDDYEVDCIGNTLSLSQQCHNINVTINSSPPCNYYAWDQFRNYYLGKVPILRSYLNVCENIRCVSLV